MEGEKERTLEGERSGSGAYLPRFAWMPLLTFHRCLLPLERSRRRPSLGDCPTAFPHHITITATTTTTPTSSSPCTCHLIPDTQCGNAIINNLSFLTRRLLMLPLADHISSHPDASIGQDTTGKVLVSPCGEPSSTVSVAQTLDVCRHSSSSDVLIPSAQPSPPPCRA